MRFRYLALHHPGRLCSLSALTNTHLEAGPYGLASLFFLPARS